MTKHSHKKVRVKIKKAPGDISISHRMHDEAVVVSGSLTVRTGELDPCAVIAEDLESAAHEVNERGGVIGHIKATAALTSTSMISITDKKAMVKESPERKVLISLAAIMFMIDPPAAETIIKQALTNARTRLIAL